MIKYPFKHPELYAELARQGKKKKDLCAAIGISDVSLAAKQNLETKTDFKGVEMRRAAQFLGVSMAKLFMPDDVGNPKEIG